MLTVLESIKLSTEFLQKKGIESPRINAELLLAKILNCKRLDLYLKFDRPLNEEEIKLYREFLSRRSKFEPLQYILGSVEFYGLEFMVDSSVLIPRPETEILVEEIINSVTKGDKLKILDIGTGSGIIAVCLAKHLPECKVIAVDSSIEALNTAKKNSDINNTAGMIDFIEWDIQSGSFLPEKDFDIVVSNPPYISAEEFTKLRPELKIYEPKTALTDSADGLSFFRVIALKSKELLKRGGRLFMETGMEQAGEVKEILLSNNYSDIKFKKDYLNIDRVVSGVSN